MKTARTIADLRTALHPLRAGERTVGLVPTMGAFHEGHLALIHAARDECDAVVVSVFVNPKQFGPGEDLHLYPRDEARDSALATEAGVDLLFAPDVAEIYPPGFQTWVEVEDLSHVLEGQYRPGHFRGGATV
jgi:pantoate--beta-alanine ligase